MGCPQLPQTLQNSTLAALVCSASPSDLISQCPCVALCPNADLAGVGVRTAFYLQSVMNTLLVIFSRRDSVPSVWASTLLTASLVIAAMVQKGNQSITLHHATLTLNFATLSCISSLAVAPTLSIWRLTPEGYYTRQLAHHVLNTFLEDSSIGHIPERDRTKIKRAQGKQRLFLALALLTQVVLQWAWGVVLFVSPVYSQPNCSGDTVLIFFLARFTAQEINDHYMVVWVFWLLFSLGITLAMTIVLALTSPARARYATASNSSRASSLSTRTSSLSGPPRHPLRTGLKRLFESVRKTIPSWGDRGKQLIFWYNVLAVVLWLVYIISAEIQIQTNYIFEGENVISSFGQITALLLAAQPVWNLTVALYRWPAAQRRLERQRRREQAEVQQVLGQAKPTLSPLALAGAQHVTARIWTPASSPVRGRSRSVLVVSAEHATPLSAIAVPSAGESGLPETAAARGRARRGALSSRVSAEEWHDLSHVYIPRTDTEEWNELVSLTHLPRAPTFS